MNKLNRYVGSGCEILSGDHIIVGRIKDGCDYGFKISTNMNSNFLKPKESCRVSIISEKIGDIILGGQIHSIEEDSVVVHNIEILSDKNIRKHFRVNAQIETEIFHPQYLEDELLVKVCDLSLGGVKISCKEEFEKGEEIVVKLNIEEETLFLTALIRSKIPGEGINRYGCEFIDIDSHDEDLLNRYIFFLDRMSKT